MATKKIEQNDFSGGITENMRDTSGNKVWVTENVILEKNLVTQTQNFYTINSGNYNVDYGVIKLINIGTSVYGIGRDNGTNRDTSLYQKNLGGNNWALLTNGTIANSSQSLYDPSFIYNNDFYIYFNGGNNYICRYNIVTNAMTSNYLSLNGGLDGGILWQGNMYGYQGQKIYKITTAPAAVDMLTIPSDQQIKQMVPYGNYIAIICTSKMYLWDGVTTTSFADIVEIGRGICNGGSLLDGILYVVETFSNYRGFRIKAYSGGRFVTVSNYTGRFNRARSSNYTKGASTVVSSTGFISFLVSAYRSDSTYAGGDEIQLFRYGKINADDVNSLSCWKTFNTQSGAQAPSTIGNSFVVLEDSSSSLQSQIISSVIYGLDTGVGSSSYFESANTFNATESVSSASAVIETVIFNGGNTHAQKTLQKVVLNYDPLPTAGSVTLKYKINEETNKAASTWTTIFTDTTDYNVSHAAVNIESTGANLPTFKEIQFRIELSGNAKLTGLKFVFEELTEDEY